jgi:hypothetical protein
MRSPDSLSSSTFLRNDMPYASKCLLKVGEEGKDALEEMKVDRMIPAFLKVIKSDSELWTQFVDFFKSQETFITLIERKRYSTALSGVMRIFIDIQTIQGNLTALIQTKERRLRS